MNGGYPTWLRNVLPNFGFHGIGKWDYKDNKETIFGVAWAYDQEETGDTRVLARMFFNLEICC